MKKLMLNHAFKHIDQVIFKIGEDNVRSRKAVEKIGAKLLKKIETTPPDTDLKSVKVVYALNSYDFSNGPLSVDSL